METTDTDAESDRMFWAIRNWMIALQEYPGWREWQRRRIGYTLRFDDDIIPSGPVGDFQFDPETNAKHEVVVGYLALLDTVSSLRDVEWYFRRYPFSGTRVTRHNHLSHCCEMYFNRFYQFKERLKELLNCINNCKSCGTIVVGPFIKSFDRRFKQELRERNSVHHRERFEDITISRVYLAESILTQLSEGYENRQYLSHYRRAANEWAGRVRQRSNDLDAFVNAVSREVLQACPFFDDTKANHAPQKE